MFNLLRIKGLSLVRYTFLFFIFFVEKKACRGKMGNLTMGHYFIVVTFRVGITILDRDID